MFVPRKLARYVADIVHRARCLICLSADYHKKFYFKGWSRYIILSFYFSFQQIESSQATVPPIPAQFVVPENSLSPRYNGLASTPLRWKVIIDEKSARDNNCFLETRIFKGIKKTENQEKKTVGCATWAQICWMCPFCCREMSSQVWRSTGSCSELGSRGGSFEGQGIEIDPKGSYRNPWHFSDWVP